MLMFAWFQVEKDSEEEGRKAGSEGEGDGGVEGEGS